MTLGDSFVHLHVHTEYSMLDGAARVAPLFAEAQRLGMPAVAVTDHGNMYGSAEFYRQSRKSAVKPIIGIEAYIAPASRHHKKPIFWGHANQRGADEFGEGGNVSGAGAYTHMTMLAADAVGLRNLFRLSSLASFEGHYRKPRMDRDLIGEHAGGIIATTGCASGEVQTHLRLGQFDEAMETAAAYRDIFGADSFFVELMDHGIPMERVFRADLLRLASQLGLRTVVTNDSHYVTRDQATEHSALLCVQTGKTLTDPARFRFEGDGYYLKSAEEMRGFWDSEVPGACQRTLEIAERIGSYDEVFAPVDRMPRVAMPHGKTAADALRAEVEFYLPTRFPQGISEEYRARIKWELEVICSKDYASYFLVVGDLVRWAKSQGIRVGPGRGSATGVLVCYILHIVSLDPIEHSLIFERFLNPERDSPPDIDLDFDDRRRGEVFDYVRDRYGAENVAQVITFGRIKTKAAIKDAARVHYGPTGFSIAERITKALPPPVAAEDIPLRGIVDPQHERYREASGVRDLIASDVEARTIFDTARGLEGLVRNAGVHACALILSSEPLLDVLPLWRRQDGATITGWDYPSCEDVGLLKMDFLGVTMLTVIGDALAGVEANHGAAIDLDALGLDDATTYELIARGDTLGVFQLDGAGMRSLLTAMHPTHFGDVSAALALYRPGPMAANAHTDYAERSNGRQKIEPIHPELREALEPILGETYHLLVYQEQVMAIAQQLAGYTLGGADLLRKGMGKKKPEIIAKESAKFLDGMKSSGFSAAAAQTLWDVMVPFAGYAFNKSHTAGYAVISYWSAYLKAHYPAEFMAAQLTANADNKDKLAVYLAECRRMGIKVLPPDVNESALHFSAVGTDVRFGLGAIRNVGANAANSIIHARGAGRYTGFLDFLQKSETVCSKRMIESLIKAGAFDSLGHTRLGLFQCHAAAVDAAMATKREESHGQVDLFGDALDADLDGPDGEANIQIAPVEWPARELLAFEREMLGLYVSSHPLSGAALALRGNSDHVIAELVSGGQPDGSQVRIAGMVSVVQRKTTKTGGAWAILTVEDLDASIEVRCLTRCYVVVRDFLREDAVISVQGRLDCRGGARVVVVADDVAIVDVDGDGEQPVVVTSSVELAAESSERTAEDVLDFVWRHLAPLYDR